MAITILDNTDKIELENKIGALHTQRIATLSVGGWNNNTQNVSVNGATANNIVFVAPSPDSQDEYTSAGIKCITQAQNALTFSCKTVPTVAINVNVIIVGA